jgi:outer membrane protein assembly factor BamA
VKGGPNGAEIAQQSYLFQIDIPDVVKDVLRLKLTASYQRTVDQGYFGVGNGTTSALPSDLMGSEGRFFQFDQREAVLRSLSRIVLRRPYELMVATNFRYVHPSAYDGSRLARDSAQADLRGLRGLVPLAVGVGLGYDTRDNEFFPRRGAFHQVGVKVTYGLPASASVAYGQVGSVLAGFLPIGGPFVFAARGVVDAQFGHVPFYDLFTGGVFQTQYLPGGPEGVRGVPIGRYSGLIKLVANAELRALLYEFHILGAPFHLGGNVFADAGRAWKDYHFSNTADGSGVGLKWGAGAGVYLQWGLAAIFRAEFAYSPDAAALNRGFPIGVYVSDGVMF